MHSTVRKPSQWNPWESASSFTKCSNPPRVCFGSPLCRRQRLDQGCHRARPYIKVAVFGVAAGFIPARYTAEITIPKQTPRRHGYHGMRFPDLPGQTLYALLPSRQPDEQVARVRHIMQKVFEPFSTAKKVGEGSGLTLSVSFGIVSNFCSSLHTSISQDSCLYKFFTHIIQPQFT
jgi:hypothetical protein